MGKFNKNFKEYAADNFISAEELQKLGLGYTREHHSSRPGENDDEPERRFTDEKAFWKKFKKNYKRAGSEKLGIAGVAGRADREKLVEAFKNPQYGPPVVEEKEKKEDWSIPEARDYNLDFSSTAFKMEELDGLKDYDTDEIRKDINKAERLSKDPGTFGSYLDRLRGKVSKPDKMMVNKKLERDIKINKKQIKKASAFNPDPIKMTSFKDAKVGREQYISKEDKKRIDFYKKNFKQNSDSAFERKPKKSKMSIKPTKSSGAFDREVKQPLMKKKKRKP